MLDNLHTRLVEGDTFAIVNSGKTFTPQTDNFDLLIEELPADVDRITCPDDIKVDIENLINFIF